MIQRLVWFDLVFVSTRMVTDTQLVQDGTGEKVPMLFMNVCTFIAAFVVAFTTNWLLTLVLITCVPVLGITVAVFRRFIVKYTQKSLESYAQAGNVAEEALIAIRTVTAFSAMQKLAHHYAHLLVDAEKYAVRKQALTGVIFGAFMFIIYSTYALAFYHGGTLLIEGKIDPGQIVTCFFSVLIGAFSLAGSSGEMQAIGLCIGAAAGLYRTIDSQPAIDVYSTDGKTLEKVSGRVVVEDVQFRYPSRPDRLALHGLSVTVEPGHTLALVGASGSGKSTIIQLLERFYDPENGKILLDGVDLRELNVAWLRQQIGYVTQEPTLFKATIFENVAYGLIGSRFEHVSDDEKQRLIVEACKNANAHDFIMKLPDSYQTQIGERGLLLSGGQKQRIAIARAIVKDPKILLLDEATSALDTQSERIVQTALESASKGRTTIVIAHRLSSIRNSDLIVVMEQGKVIEQGNHGSLMDIENGVYRKMVDAQNLDVKPGAKKVEDVEGGNYEKLDPDAIIMDESLQRVETTKENGDIELKTVKTDKTYAEDLSMGGGHYFDKAGSLQLFYRIMKLNAPEKWYTSVGVFACVVNGMIMPLFALIFGSILQVFYGKANLREDTNFWALMFFIIALIAGVSNFFKFVMFGIAGEKLTTRIRDSSFQAMMQMEIGWFDEEKNSVGQLTTSLSSSAQQVQNMSGSILGSFLELSVSVVGAAIVSIVVGWKLGLVVLSCLPLIILANKMRMDMMRKGNVKTKEHYEKSAQIACEAIGAIRTVMALTREKNVFSIYESGLQKPLKIGQHHALVGSIWFAISQSFNLLINALAFWYGAELFRTDGYDIKQMFVVLMASIFAGQSSGRVFSMMPDMSRSMLYAKDILNLLDRKPRITPSGPGRQKFHRDNIKGTIEFKNVNFEYPTRPGIPVLRGLNLRVDPGQYVALVGSSGCGKSTTMSIVENFYDISGGEVLIDGLPVSKLDLNSLRQIMSIVSQEPNLFNMSIRENISIGIPEGAQVTDEMLIQAAKEANIHEFIDGLPEKYDTSVGGKGSQLSGGQKQRIAIARSLILKPKILLLDEATSALDGQSEKVVQATLDEASKGRTTLSIAHRLSTIKHANCIYVFQNGVVVEQGTHEELVALGGLYHQLATQQDLNA